MLFCKVLCCFGERVNVAADLRSVAIAEPIPFCVNTPIESFHAENGEDARGKPAETRVAGFVACNVAVVAFSHDTEGIFTLC